MRRWGRDRKMFSAFDVVLAGFAALVACGQSPDETRQEMCQAKADVFREHVVSSDFTVEEADRLARGLTDCNSTIFDQIREVAASDPSTETYDGRLAMLVSHHDELEAEQARLQQEQERAAEERRQRIAKAQSSPECAKARQEYAAFRPADVRSRDFYDRNVLPVTCRGEPAEDPAERMATKEERIAEQVALLRASAKAFVELTGVSERCASLHAGLELEKFKAEHGWRPLLTDDQISEYYGASTSACPPDHVILD